MSGQLILEDGTTIDGISFGANANQGGEVVFQTGMVGYCESLTDPSYKGQILILSYPLIGNYGVPSDEKDVYGLQKYFESEKIHVAGLIVAEYSAVGYSHWAAKKSLSDWLKEHEIPALYNIDTRALIQKIRDNGVLKGKIVVNTDNSDCSVIDPDTARLVAQVTTDDIQHYGEGDKTVLVVDCGVKYNQMRCLLKRGLKIKRVPYDYDFTMDDDYDAIFVSNGPGNPDMCESTVKHIRTVLNREAPHKIVPVFGICLGHQLIARAAGATTRKMKFGHRSQNQPCIDQTTGRCHLTMQNHGYQVDAENLPAQWVPYFINANDGTNAGIRHASKPYFTVQFHPEANAGPKETEYLFDMFLNHINGLKHNHVPLAHKFAVAEPYKPKKVLILGSGGLSIGQAGEFDYSGSQAIKALKEEGIYTILLNPNIATVQTMRGMADKVYFLPVTAKFVIRILEEEKPDGILLTFGGQTALNTGIELWKEGIFKKYNVEVLGTPIEAINNTEDRGIFAQKLEEIGESIAPSVPCHSIQAALDAADNIGYPVIVRAGFALGGLGSGFADNKDELTNLAVLAFAKSSQILVERSLYGWKEVEYEVVRDCEDNCITVCNMENFDPLGIHTGESIVIAPSQTLDDAEYHMLRMVALRVVRHLGVIGECNIQIALDPCSRTYYIIEVNARLSRSSALASKATGYPLAAVSAKLALGHTLHELRNSVTGITSACFEPSMDYVVIKIPRWDLNKFEKVSSDVGTAMKSVGEVMAIGRTFTETMQKAVRMAYPGTTGFQSDFGLAVDDSRIAQPSDNRILVLAQALSDGYTVDEIHNLSKIDKWFLMQLKRISCIEGTMKKDIGSIAQFTKTSMLQAKKLGFSDLHIAQCIGANELQVRALRKSFNVTPSVKQIDTVAAEYPAINNYLYLTYHGSKDDVAKDKGGVIVLGSGAYCIGSSVEFDWGAVVAARTLKASGKLSIMINYNPETVSTDYDECDSLYFEELTFETVCDIYEREAPEGVIISFGGQIPNCLAPKLHEYKVNILGTPVPQIERAENRFVFSKMLDDLAIDQPEWKECSSITDTLAFCNKVGYPCLVRPSFVLSGSGMSVAHSDAGVKKYLERASAINSDHPVVISKFIVGAKEIDVDAVAVGGEIIVKAVSEHVENAGVHSGDATLVLPPQSVGQDVVDKIASITSEIGKNLKVTGPFNIQYIVKGDDIKVIECNLRSSRSFPFVSKTLGVNFISIATKAILGERFEDDIAAWRDSPQANSRIGVKASQFSFSRLQGSDPRLGVEMHSTGEVACFDTSIHGAFLKALVATGFRKPDAGTNVLLSLGSYSNKLAFLPYAKKLQTLGYQLYGTPGTADFLSANEVDITALMWPEEGAAPSSSVDHLISSGSFGLALVYPSKYKHHRSHKYDTKGYKIRRLAIDFGVPLVTNVQKSMLLVDALQAFPNGALYKLKGEDSVEAVLN